MHTVAEIATQLDIPPADALELVVKAGVTRFWHEGREFRDPYHLLAYLSGHWQYDATPDLEFDAAPAQMAAVLESEIEQVLSEACVEIVNLTAANNPVARRLSEVRKLLEAA